MYIVFMAIDRRANTHLF